MSISYGVRLWVARRTVSQHLDLYATFDGDPRCNECPPDPLAAECPTLKRALRLLLDNAEPVTVWDGPGRPHQIQL